MHVDRAPPTTTTRRMMLHRATSLNHQLSTLRDLVKQWDVFVSKYLWEGQRLVESARREHGTWWARHRCRVAVAAPIVLSHLVYWPIAIHWNLLPESTESSAEAHRVSNWYIAMTMVLGAFVAGVTSEGGGAVAFPVLTLAFEVSATTARDFSFMAQSCGMTAASLTILLLRLQLEWRTLIYSTMGGIPGFIVGVRYVWPAMPPPYPKMVFVSVWLAFAFALFLVNRNRQRLVYARVPFWERGVLVSFGPFAVNWKALVLVLVGFVGGINTALNGAGIDITAFSVLTILFRVSEKVATPTSILLMACNSAIGFVYRVHTADPPISRDSWDFFRIAIPVVTTFAPLGALVSSYFHRLVHAAIVYTLDIAQFLGAILLVKPWSKQSTDHPRALSLSIFIIIISGCVVFQALSCLGEVLVDLQEPWSGEEVEQGSDDCRMSDDSLHAIDVFLTDIEHGAPTPPAHTHTHTHMCARVCQRAGGVGGEEGHTRRTHHTCAWWRSGGVRGRGSGQWSCWRRATGAAEGALYHHRHHTSSPKPFAPPPGPPPTSPHTHTATHTTPAPLMVTKASARLARTHEHTPVCTHQHTHVCNAVGARGLSSSVHTRARARTHTHAHAHAHSHVLRRSRSLSSRTSSGSSSGASGGGGSPPGGDMPRVIPFQEIFEGIPKRPRSRISGHSTDGGVSNALAAATPESSSGAHTDTHKDTTKTGAHTDTHTGSCANTGTRKSTGACADARNTTAHSAGRAHQTGGTACVKPLPEPRLRHGAVEGDGELKGGGRGSVYGGSGSACAAGNDTGEQ